MNRIILASLLAAASVPPLSFAATPTEPTVQIPESPQPGAAKLPFSEAVRAGDLLYLSGQIGVETGSDTLVAGGIKPEARQTMDNIKALLEEQGYSLRDVVKCTVMLADIAERQAFNEVYVSYFSKPYPARSAFGTTGLALNARVEVECIAARER